MQEELKYISFLDDPCYNLLWAVNDWENRHQSVEIYQYGAKVLSMNSIRLTMPNNGFYCMKAIGRRGFHVPTDKPVRLVCEQWLWY